MQFKEWFRQSGLTQQGFADLVNEKCPDARMARPYVSRLLAGKLRPSTYTIERIKIATEDAVRASDWGVK